MKHKNSVLKFSASLPLSKITYDQIKLHRWSVLISKQLKTMTPMTSYSTGAAHGVTSHFHAECIESINSL